MRTVWFRVIQGGMVREHVYRGLTMERAIQAVDYMWPKGIGWGR